MTNIPNHEPMIAVIDLDGVVYDFETAIAKWIHTSTGRSYETMPMPARSWQWFAEQWDPPMTKNEFYGHMRSGVLQGHLWGCGDPQDGIDTMAAWRSILEPLRVNDPHFYIHVITSRGSLLEDGDGTATALTSSWLNTWGFHYDRLSVVKNTKGKIDAAEELRMQLDVEPANVFSIDDKDTNAFAFAEAGYTSCLGARPHNENLGANLEPLIWGRKSFLDWCLSIHLRVQ